MITYGASVCLKAAIYRHCKGVKGCDPLPNALSAREGPASDSPEGWRGYFSGTIEKRMK